MMNQRGFPAVVQANYKDFGLLLAHTEHRSNHIKEPHLDSDKVEKVRK